MGPVINKNNLSITNSYTIKDNELVPTHIAFECPNKKVNSIGANGIINILQDKNTFTVTKKKPKPKKTIADDFSDLVEIGFLSPYERESDDNPSEAIPTKIKRDRKPNCKRNAIIITKALQLYAFYNPVFLTISAPIRISIAEMKYIVTEIHELRRLETLKQKNVKKHYGYINVIELQQNGNPHSHSIVTHFIPEEWIKVTLKRLFYLTIKRRGLKPTALETEKINSYTQVEYKPIKGKNGKIPNYMSGKPQTKKLVSYLTHVNDCISFSCSKNLRNAVQISRYISKQSVLNENKVSDSIIKETNIDINGFTFIKYEVINSQLLTNRNNQLNHLSDMLYNRFSIFDYSIFRFEYLGQKYKIKFVGFEKEHNPISDNLVTVPTIQNIVSLF